MGAPFAAFEIDPELPSSFAAHAKVSDSDASPDLRTIKTTFSGKSPF
jgi:hypothetical protein